MSETFLAIKGTRDGIAELTNSSIEGEFSEPEFVTSPSDVLDAPLDPDQIKEVLQLITAAFGTASALFKFIELLIDKAKERNSGFTLLNPQSGQVLTSVDGQSSVDEIMTAITHE